MNFDIKSTAKEKMSDIPERDYVENTVEYKRSEFLRTQLKDEAELSFINLNNIFHMIENNFSDSDETKYWLDTLSSEMKIVQSNFDALFEHLSKETEL